MQLEKKLNEDRNQLMLLVFLLWAFGIIYMPYSGAPVTGEMGLYILYAYFFLQLAMLGYALFAFARLAKFVYVHRGKGSDIYLRLAVYVYVLMSLVVAGSLTAGLIYYYSL